MSNRIVRINELVQREINDILRQRYAAEAVSITVTEVRIAPDLRDGRVFVAILGTDDEVESRFRWLRKHAVQVREELSKRIVLKFLPRMTYVLDKSTFRAAKVLQALDALPPVPERSDETGHGHLLP